MNKILFLLALVTLIGCGFPGVSDGPSQSSHQPSAGCNQDVKVHYRNNCGKNLIVFFIEVNPGTPAICESLERMGSILVNQRREFTIHKGKTAFFVFAEDEEGKCNGGHRKSEAWVNCEQASSSEASFDVCH